MLWELYGLNPGFGIPKKNSIPDPDPGVKKALDPRSWTCNTKGPYSNALLIVEDIVPYCTVPY
jgi:hypothetical protein